MKIIYFYQYFGTPKGNWSTRVYENCKRWVKDGADVTVVTTPYEKSDISSKGFISNKEIEGIKLIVINLADSNRESIPKRAFKTIVFSLLSIYFALFSSYDALIASSGPITVGLPLIISKIIRRKKTVFEVRDLWPAGGIEMGLIQSVWLQKLAIWFEQMCYSKSDLIIASSVGQKQNILKRFPGVRITTIPQGADNDLFGNHSDAVLPSWTNNKTIFTHIGSIGFMNNCTLLLQAAKMLKAKNRTDIIIVLIGEGAERNDLEKYKAQNDLDNVFFLGSKPKVDLPVWVQKSRATIFTTQNIPVQDTSSPNKISDSFAAGTPIIQTTVGWIKDLVDNKQCGINVKPNSPEEIVSAVIKLTDDKSEADKLGTNAKKLAETYFNRDLLASKMLKEISNL